MNGPRYRISLVWLRRFASVFLALPLVSCAAAPQHPQADAFYASGSYLEAAEAYASDGRLAPLDHDSAVKLEDARKRAIDDLLMSAASARRRGAPEQALKDLRVVIGRRNEWGWSLPPDMAAQLNEELEEVGNLLKAKLDAPIKKGDPLTAEQLYLKSEKAIQIEDLASARERIEKAILKSGRQRCLDHARAIKDNMPYYTALVGSYCAHFRADKPPSQGRPDGASRLVVSGLVKGLTPEQLEALHKTLEDAWKDTCYYAAGSANAASAQLSGAHGIAFSATARTLSSPWTETVTIGPVVAGNKVVVPRIESDDPQASSSPMGRSKLTRDRTYSYQATEHVAKYSSTLLIKLTLAQGASSIDIHADQSRTETGYYHDVDFAPAGVKPERPNLTTPESFFALELKLARLRLIDDLKDHWYRRFCDRVTFSLEEAARCASGAMDQTPLPAMEALRAEFGGDAAELPKLSR